MATHELYLGGGTGGNASRAMFPAPTFNAAAEPFLSMRPAAHKGPKAFALNRVFDFQNDMSLREWARNATVAQGDDISALVIPKHMLLLGVHFDVETAAGVAMTITPRLRVAAAAFPTVDGNAVAAQWAQAGVVGAITANGSAATIVPWYINTPEVLDLRLTAWTAFGDLRIEVSAILIDLSSGQY
jgi:hypothetical protein